MTNRQVEFVEEGGVKIGKLTFFPGDTFTFPKAEADQYINFGWCKCKETGEIGERVAGNVSLSVDDTFICMQS